MCFPNYSLAKIISDRSGIITFETSNQWRLVSVGADPATYELISIMYDKDTFIKFTQSKFNVKYKSLRQASYAEKSELKDYMMKFYSDSFKSKGYICTRTRADCLDDSIVLGFNIKKNNIESDFVTGIYIKDYCVYSVSATCVKATSDEMIKTLQTLKINGMDYKKWLMN